MLTDGQYIIMVPDNFPLWCIKHIVYCICKIATRITSQQAEFMSLIIKLIKYFLNSIDIRLSYGSSLRL